MWRFGPLLAVGVSLAGCGDLSIVGCGVADNVDRRTPLEKAAQEGDAAGVERLLASGADPNGEAGMFGSPLSAAMFAPETPGNAEVLRLLLAACANPSGRVGEEGRRWLSPLWHAAMRGDLDSVRVLLEAGAAVPQPHGAELNAASLDAPIADLLVEHGFDLMAVDGQGRNQLHVALGPPDTPKLEGVEYLARAGVPLNARDHSGKTPLDYWREPRYVETHWIQSGLIEWLAGDAFF